MIARALKSLGLMRVSEHEAEVKRLRKMLVPEWFYLGDETSSDNCRSSPWECIDMDRVAGLGNAVVPQIPEMIGHAILAAKAMSARQSHDPQGHGPKDASAAPKGFAQGELP
jgi:hypothetical protein